MEHEELTGAKSGVLRALDSLAARRMIAVAEFSNRLDEKWVLGVFFQLASEIANVNSDVFRTAHLTPAQLKESDAPIDVKRRYRAI